ncbi:hypothetical protein GCM10010507_60720 [Streptomyces cinnamoneus]|uniref:Uncharacterized protein n=1 Tax=Streptomyces cinnamoneus TaxID=53446 RepID=A0A918U0Z1_STRCJ|nr:hypothetical protein GCM10010507_60720 [Streptomyces cinnamoneus]
MVLCRAASGRLFLVVPGGRTVAAPTGVVSVTCGMGRGTRDTAGVTGPAPDARGCAGTAWRNGDPLDGTAVPATYAP